jgi:hypothetical protein
MTYVIRFPLFKPTRGELNKAKPSVSLRATASACKPFGIDFPHA